MGPGIWDRLSWVIFFFMWVAARVIVVFSWQNGLGCMWGGPGYLCCHVWCLAWGGAEGKAQLAPFSLHRRSPKASPCGLCSRSPGFFTVAQDSERECSSKEKLWGIWRANLRGLGYPSATFCSCRKAGSLQTDQSQEGEWELPSQWVFNWPQMFQYHMAFLHGALELGASLFLWEAKYESLLLCCLTIELLVL